MDDPESSHREAQLHLEVADERRRPVRGFAFEVWAHAARFAYPPRARLMLERVGSPAEAHLVRRLFQSPEVIAEEDGTAECRGVTIEAQVRCEPFIIDFVAERYPQRLAIEVDGWWHRETRQQIAADYRRERFLLRHGYVVIRFTAEEAIHRPTECWRDVWRVLGAQRRAAA